MRLPEIDGIPLDEYIRHYEDYQTFVQRQYLIGACKPVYMLFPETYVKLLHQAKAVYDENTRLHTLETRYMSNCIELMECYDKLNAVRRFLKKQNIVLPFEI